MALILTDSEKSYIDKALSAYSGGEFWVRETILAKLIQEKEEKEEKKNCEHKYENWEGKKVECTKCGSWTEKSWELVE